MRFSKSFVFYNVIFMTAYLQPAREEVVVLSDCTCPGHELKLLCTVVGAGFTRWRVNNCTIKFRHSRFVEGEEVGHCNGRQIVGRWRERDGQNVTIEASILANSTLAGTDVECVHDDLSRDVLIGSHRISFTTNPYKPPDDIQLTDISLSQLTFSWNPVSINCDAVHYLISATGCGVCPSVTVDTSVTCNMTTLHVNNDTLPQSMCLFSVQTVVCDDIIGNESNPYTVLLKGPSTPSFKTIIPFYSSLSKSLTKVEVQLFTLAMEPLDSVDIIVSVVSSTVIYSDFVSDSSCSSVEIPATSCVRTLCIQVIENFNSSCLLNSPKLNLTTYATSIFGHVLPSVPTIIGTTNIYFDVELDYKAVRFLCYFNESYYGTNKSCSIVYGAMESGVDCLISLRNKTEITSTLTHSNQVIISPSHPIKDDTTYCFVAKGRLLSMTIAIEGDFVLEGPTAAAQTSPDVIVITVSTICCVLGIALVLLCLGIIYKKRQQWRSLRHSTTAIEENIYMTTSEHIEHREEDIEPPPQSSQENRPEGPIYADIQVNRILQNMVLDDDPVQYAELNHEETTQNGEELNTSTPDEPAQDGGDGLEGKVDLPTMENLLLQLGPDVTTKWYQFGQALGVSKEFLDNLKAKFSSESKKCLLGVLDYWLKNKYREPMWTDVAKALKDIELSHIAKDIQQTVTQENIQV